MQYLGPVEAGLINGVAETGATNGVSDTLPEGEAFFAAFAKDATTPAPTVPMLFPKPSDVQSALIPNLVGPLDSGPQPDGLSADLPAIPRDPDVSFPKELLSGASLVESKSDANVRFSKATVDDFGATPEVPRATDNLSRVVSPDAPAQLPPATALPAQTEPKAPVGFQASQGAVQPIKRHTPNSFGTPPDAPKSLQLRDVGPTEPELRSAAPKGLKADGVVPPDGYRMMQPAIPVKDPERPVSQPSPAQPIIMRPAPMAPDIVSSPSPESTTLPHSVSRPLPDDLATTGAGDVAKPDVARRPEASVPLETTKRSPEPIIQRMPFNQEADGPPAAPKSPQRLPMTDGSVHVEATDRSIKSETSLLTDAPTKISEAKPVQRSAVDVASRTDAPVQNVAATSVETKDAPSKTAPADSLNAVEKQMPMAVEATRTERSGRNDAKEKPSQPHPTINASEQRNQTPTVEVKSMVDATKVPLVAVEQVDLAKSAAPIAPLDMVEGERAPTLDAPRSLQAQPTVNRADMARSVAQQMSAAVTQSADNTIDVRLSPEDLGRVRLALTPGDMGMMVTITTERPETLDLVRRHIDLFAQDLKQNGFQNLSFSFGQDTRRESERSLLPPAETPVYASDETAPAPLPVKPQNLRQDGRVDIRL